MTFKREKRKSRKKKYYVLGIVFCLSFLFFYLLQTSIAHRNGYFQPEYPRVTLNEESDYSTLFLQTGLGKAAVDKLLEKGDFQTILNVQNAFFSKDTVTCIPVIGWFTKSDRVSKQDSAPLVDLQPGDILLSLSTHSLGWNHGHAGLVLNETSVLECTSWGKNSEIKGVEHWRNYSNYVVLRVQGVTKEMQNRVVSFAKENMCDVPYRLTAGFFGEKALSTENQAFGLQCAYLVWYAWQEFGYDLDSDGGRLVTMQDILESQQLEIVQIYGINPLEFY